MRNNLIVLRHSPDWLNFDLEDSRHFLRSVELPEDLVIEFAAIWDRSFKLSYREIRAGVKAIALDTVARVEDADIISQEEWDGSVPAGRIAFVDDDDWFSETLFSGLPASEVGEDGVLWGSVRFGRVFKEPAYDAPLVERRPIDRTVYTNNYAVTPKALYRLGSAELLEHFHAQVAFDRPDFCVTGSEQYLSCAVKHPCSTMSARYFVNHQGFCADPRPEMEAFLAAASAIRLDGGQRWMEAPLSQFVRLFSAAF